MMVIVITTRLLCCVAYACLPVICLAEESSTAAMSCIERLVIPQYPPAARSAGISDTVRVVISWKDEGSPRWQIRSTKPHFVSAIEEALRRSTFAKNCARRETEITLEFRVTHRRSDGDEPLRSRSRTLCATGNSMVAVMWPFRKVSALSELMSCLDQQILYLDLQAMNAHGG